jgi:hypothetical protein
MYAYAIPIEIILFQLLVLLVVVAVEAAVFYEQFALTRKQSLEYSVIVNLFSGIVSWILFFVIQRILPEALRLEMISYVFLNKLYRGEGLISIPSILMILGIVNFLFVCVIEFSGSSILQNLGSTEASVPPEKSTSALVNLESKNKKEVVPLLKALVLNDPNTAFTILTANTVSNGLIFLLFSILRLLY